MDAFEQDEAEIHNEMAEREIRPRQEGDPLAQICLNDELYSHEEVKELARRQRKRIEAIDKDIKEKWLASQAGELCMAFFEAFEAYRAYLAANPSEWDKAKYYFRGEIFDEHKLFEQGLRAMADYTNERNEKLQRNLEKAQRAARCQHLHVSGEQCGSPRVRGKKLCYMHERMEEAKTERLDLGPLEDPDSIQMAIKKLQGAIIEGKLETKQVGQLAYTIQLAAWNVTRTSMMMRESESSE